MPALHSTLQLLGVFVATSIGTITCVLLYFGISFVHKRCGRFALLNPVFLSVTLLSSSLLVLQSDVQGFQDSAGLLLFILPVCVSALAMPIYRLRDEIMRHKTLLLWGVLAGTLFSAVASLGLGLALYWQNPGLAGAMLPKSITAPVAQNIAEVMGVDFSLAGAIAIATGICGAVFGPLVLRLFSPKHAEIAGIAIGTVSHGIATAQLFAEGYKVAGTFAGLAMALCALCGAMLLPPMWFLVGWLLSL